MSIRLFIACLCCFLLSACSVTTVYYSPNNFKNLPATVFLHNGDSVNGMLSLNNEVLIKKVKMKANSEKEINYHVLELTSYKTGDKVYELKHRMDRTILGKSDYFMKRLTPDGSNIHLYEHSEKHYEHRSSKRVTYQTKYFIQFPNEHRNAVWALNSKRLVPYFHQKMGEVISDCKDLQQKVLNKEKGYYYQHFNSTPKERADIVLRIINEFNRCK